MQYRILGPLGAVADAGEVTLGGPKQRLVLAVLILHVNHQISTSRLIDDVWGDDPPETARNSLQSYISHLRKTLGTSITGGAGGYTLQADPTAIDAVRFESMIGEARALAAVDPVAGAVIYEEALALWRGSAFADLASEPCLQGEIVRLDELRLLATEQRLDVVLSLGHYATVVGDLESLIKRHGMRESLWGRLIVALYRSGRQSDALAAYGRARTLLLEELGIDPSVELQDLYQKVLLQDPSLLGPPPAALPPAALPSGPPAGHGVATGAERVDPIRAVPRHRLRRWVAVGGLVALVASTVGIVVHRSRDGAAGPEFAPFEPGMAIIDGSNGERVAFVPESVVRAPVEAIFAEGAFWVVNLEPLSFAQIDPDSGEVLRQIASPIDDIGYFTVVKNDLWITHFTRPSLSKVDIALGREVLRVDDLPGEGGSNGVVVADGSVWVARRDASDGLGALVRLDPATGEVQHITEPLIGSYALSYGDDGALWTAGTYGHVNRVDLSTNVITTANVGARNFYLATGGGFGWTTDEATGTLFQIDRAGAVVASYPTGEGARSVAFSEGRVWVGNQDAGTVTAVDVSTGESTSYLFDRPINSIAAGGGRVLVQLTAGVTFEGRLAELGGTVAKFFVGAYELDPLDPALLDTPLGLQVMDATCATLLRREPGESDSITLTPDLASDLPTVSADGRTYTFQLAGDVRFSPPSNEQVTAETVRRSIERAVSPVFGPSARGATLLDDIEGVEAFQDGDATRISGITVDGAYLAITLVAPSTTILDRLTSSALCPVPIGTPTIPSTGGVQVPTGDGPSEFLAPSSGPYFVARYATGEFTVLQRNPNYTGTRPHVFDAIVLREGIAPEQARSLVTSGDWDGILHLLDGTGSTFDLIGETIGCRKPLAATEALDLTAMCPSARD